MASAGDNQSLARAMRSVLAPETPPRGRGASACYSRAEEVLALIAPGLTTRKSPTSSSWLSRRAPPRRQHPPQARPWLSNGTVAEAARLGFDMVPTRLAGSHSSRWSWSAGLGELDIRRSGSSGTCWDPFVGTKLGCARPALLHSPLRRLVPGPNSSSLRKRIDPSAEPSALAKHERRITECVAQQCGALYVAMSVTASSLASRHPIS